MSPRWPRILMYHAVAHIAQDPNEVFTSPEQFKAHMLHLKRRGLRGVSMQEFRRAMSMGSTKGLVGLTFDDGYEDFLHTAVPILESLGFSATVFVVVGLLGGKNDWEFAYEPKPHLRLLKAEDLREVSERGMEIGSHSMTHPRLSGLHPKLLEEEVSGSRQALSEIVGERVEGFCYPYGNLDRAAIEAVRRAEYGYACAWKVQYEYSHHDIPRIPMSEKDKPLRLATKLQIYSQYTKIKDNSWFSFIRRRLFGEKEMRQP
jgi:peptidoglycan/xylan/chitin deacetylase (PgdA/CDA1 family)